MDFEKIATGTGDGTPSISLGPNPPGAATNTARDGVTLYGPANEDLMTIRSIERDGDALVIKGQAYGTMPITLWLRPEQARRLLKLLRFSLLPFLIGFLFRRGKPPDPEKSQ